MAFIYDLTDTWNAGGTTFNAIKMNVTDTASAAASKLVTLQVGGSERFGVDKTGIASFAGVVRGPLGSVSAPAFSFTGDTNTGIYSPASDTLAFVEGGVEAMRIDSSANVGIGATASAGTTLRIGKNLTGAINGLGVYNNQAVQSDVTSSAQLFSTFPSTAAAAFTLGSLTHFGASQSTIGATSAVTNQYGFLAQSTLTGATNNYGFFSNIASGTGRWNFYAAGTAVNYFAGNVGIGTTSPGERLVVEGATPFILVNNTDETKSGIRFADAQNTGERFQLVYDAGAAAMCFDRVESTGVFTERMRITAAGDVGIGTSSPSARLHIVNSSLGNQLRLQDVTTDVTRKYGAIASAHYTNSEEGLSLITGDSGLSTSAVYIGGGVSTLNAASVIQFYTAANNTTLAGTERMRIDSSGNVGIGTSSPNAAARLDVSSTTSGFLPPRMTTAQRDAIVSPPNGLMLYNTTTDKLQVRAAGSWVDLH
jgi:hypothetical protein